MVSQNRKGPSPWADTARGSTVRPHGEPSHDGQAPRRAVGPAEHPGSLVVADDLLGPRVPAERVAPEAHGDVAEVADGDRPMGDLHRRRRRPSREDAIDEVLEM